MAYKLSFIGAGNLAWHLAPAFENAGYGVLEVYSRTPSKANELVNRLYEAEVKKNLDFSRSKADVFIIATSDDAVQTMAQDIVLPNDESVLAHTSGSLSAGVLTYAATEHIGILYPLQSFSKDKKVSFENVPVCVEGESPMSQGILMELGRAISTQVISINSDQRMALHVAAVFANNFVNHFLSVADKILIKNKLDSELLYALVEETILKAIELGPANVQTGPAKRHDYETLDRHLEYLKDDDELAEVYRIVSQHIVDSNPLD